MANGYRNILVRGVNRIGDTVFSLPSVTALKHAFPQARLTVLAKPQVMGLFLHNPAVDETIPLEDRGRHKGLAGRWRLVLELRKRKFDLAVVLHNCFDAALVPFLAGIPERIGYVKEHRGFLLTRSLPFPREPVHQVDHYLALLSLIGVTAGDKVPRLFIDHGEKEWAEGFLNENTARRPLVGIIPSSIARTRRWFPERFASVGDRLTESTGGSVILLGGPGDAGISEAIKGHMKTRSVDATGRTGIRQLMALIEHCDLIISNDTGPMHLAWALGKPVVTFLGAADIREIRPLSPKVHIINKELPCSPCIKEECPAGTTECLELITADEVYESAVEMLRRHGPEKNTGHKAQLHR
jgi:heptosyltransferase-2